jgi:hypothetical protein
VIESYVRHSPSSLNLFAAEPALFVLEKILGVKQPANVLMSRGTAVEAGVAAGLLDPNIYLEDCINIALTRYDTLTAMSPDGRREKTREGIHHMVTQALDALKPFGVPSSMQGFVEWHPEGLLLPIIGYYDFFWEDKGFIVDLKTTDKMPSAIKTGHARQVGFYANGNLSSGLTYVTPKKCETYQLENSSEHREALRQIALRVEKFLSLSDDPEFFVGITVPNLDGFYWNDPKLRQLAYEFWKI